MFPCSYSSLCQWQWQCQCRCQCQWQHCQWRCHVYVDVSVSVKVDVRVRVTVSVRVRVGVRVSVMFQFHCHCLCSCVRALKVVLWNKQQNSHTNVTVNYNEPWTVNNEPRTMNRNMDPDTDIHIQSQNSEPAWHKKWIKKFLPKIFEAFMNTVST